MARPNSVILFDDRLVIVDLKYGMGVKVDAEDNEQLQLYALGLNKSLAAERDEAVLRARNVDEWLSRAMAEGVKLREALQGALVRDAKTGRMRKWIEPTQAETFSADVEAHAVTAVFTNEEQTNAL